MVCEEGIAVMGGPLPPVVCTVTEHRAEVVPFLKERGYHATVTS